MDNSPLEQFTSRHPGHHRLPDFQDGYQDSFQLQVKFPPLNLGFKCHSNAGIRFIGVIDPDPDPDSMFRVF